MTHLKAGLKIGLKTYVSEARSEDLYEDRSGDPSEDRSGDPSEDKSRDPSEDRKQVYNDKDVSAVAKW